MMLLSILYIYIYLTESCCFLPSFIALPIYIIRCRYIYTDRRMYIYKRTYGTVPFQM